MLRAEKEESENDDDPQDKDDHKKDNKKDNRTKKKDKKVAVKKDKKNKDKDKDKGLTMLKQGRFGSVLPLSKVMVGKNVRSVYRVSWFSKAGGGGELAPIRPSAALRAPLTLKAGELARLV